MVPGPGGVFDYAARLVNGLEDAGVQIRHIELLQPHIDRYMSVSSGDTVFVQLSAYGFQRRGLPFGLIQWIAEQKRAGRRVGCFFHELYAFGPVWRSSFWLSPFQRYIAARIARLCDFWMTNRQASGQWLRRAAGDKPNAVLPVFSNVGEAPRFNEGRRRRLIVFGSAGSRRAAYGAAGKKLFKWAGESELEIHDVGPPLSSDLIGSLLKGNVTIHGSLEVERIRELFDDAMFGLVAYPTAYLGKSGIFAAYSAFGLCPMVFSREYNTSDGLAPGKHYLQADSIDGRLCANPSEVGKSAWLWYQDHNVRSHVETIARLTGLASHAGGGSFQC